MILGDFANAVTGNTGQQDPCADDCLVWRILVASQSFELG